MTIRSVGSDTIKNIALNFFANLFWSGRLRTFRYLNYLILLLLTGKDFHVFKTVYGVCAKL